MVVEELVELLLELEMVEIGVDDAVGVGLTISLTSDSVSSLVDGSSG